jgi:integrase
VDYFGAGRDLSMQDAREWAERLAEMQTRSGERMTAGTIRHHLNTLSNLFRHTASEGRIPTSYNPVRDLLDKPTARRVEARWLEVYDAALLLESCRTYQSKRPDLCLPYLYPLVATYLLTGGRRREVLGLEVSDVNFERKVVTFRPSAWRRLKSATSHRSVPLFPQLEAILRAYLSERTARQVLGNEPTRALLFPAEGPNGEALVSDFRKGLDGAAIRAGFSEPVIRGADVAKDKRGKPVLQSTCSATSLPRPGFRRSTTGLR